MRGDVGIAPYVLKFACCDITEMCYNLLILDDKPQSVHTDDFHILHERGDTMEFPKRKQIRIENHDYSQLGAYFITICTQNREQLLSTIVGDDAHIVPKPYGSVMEKYIRNVPEIDKYIIMPDHVHMIIRLEQQNESNDDVVHQTKSSRIASIVPSIKALTTKEIGVSIFQRSYYDHVIRNQNDYNEIWEYIENNPKKWVMKKRGWE